MVRPRAAVALSINCHMMTDIRQASVQPAPAQPAPVPGSSVQPATSARQASARRNAPRQDSVRHDPVAPTRTRRLAPGGSIDAHRHDDHQIVYAGRGVLTVTTSAGSWVAPATRAIWVPAGTVHAHRAYGELDLHLVGLPVTENPLGLETPTVLAVSPLLRELLIAYTRAEDDDRPERARLRAVLLDQLRASAQQPLHLPTPTTPLLRALCDILRADPADSRTLAELGHLVGASDRTLSRLFRSDLGMTFPQWRTQLRLHHALILLTERTPVTAVAHQCGWSSTSAFIEVFRRTFGHTPGSHRTE
ncbi:AraC family transcriptional regulator [Streptomyces griseus]|uniref:AraC family transcriptional regulator n=1 Tax=Streptomyces griseus TaxID=1911 RepID=UPI003830680C